jgi:hypothetical protein
MVSVACVVWLLWEEALIGVFGLIQRILCSPFDHRDNAVTSCLKCNGRKGSTPVSQLASIGMKLSKEPRCPTQMELAARAARMVPKRVHPTWKPYLGIAKRPASKGSSGDEEFIDDRYFEASAD